MIKKNVDRISPFEFHLDRRLIYSQFLLIENSYSRIKYENSYAKIYKLTLYENREKLRTFIREVINRHCTLEVDFLFRLFGFFKSVEYAIYDIEFRDMHFDLFLDGTIKVPFLLKSGYINPLYYIDINCINIKEFKKYQKDYPDLFSEEEKEKLAKLSCFKKRNLNTAQSSFAVGIIVGRMFLNKKIKIDEVFYFLKEPYREHYKKHKTLDIKNKCEFEGF